MSLCPHISDLFFLLPRDGYKSWDSTSKIYIFLSLRPLSPQGWEGFFNEPETIESRLFQTEDAIIFPFIFVVSATIIQVLGETTRRHPSVTVLINLHQEARTNAGIPLRLEACKEFSFMAMLACNTPNNILSMCISEVSCTWLMIGCGCFWKKTAVHGYA